MTGVNDGRLAALSLFSGIGGLDLALHPWCRTVAYCEQDRYARAVLLSRMASGELDTAPIHGDVRRLDGACLRERGIEGVDLIHGGFPCQDISTAGLGRGLAGERSGLFFEIARLAGELRPKFIFLENVAAILGRGVDAVLGALDSLGYDARWCILSAADVGAPHRRERWWCLAHAAHGRDIFRQAPEAPEAPSGRGAACGFYPCGFGAGGDGKGDILGDPDCERQLQSGGGIGDIGRWAGHSGWWQSEPPVGRMAHGVPRRVDRIRGLGNAVVPACARAAFMHLAGLRMLP